MNDVCFESDAVVAEGVIRLDCDMFRLRASVLFQNLKQCFAVWAGAIVCRDKQNWALSHLGSERDEVPFCAVLEDLCAQCCSCCARKREQVGRVYFPHIE